MDGLIKLGAHPGILRLIIAVILPSIKIAAMDILKKTKKIVQMHVIWYMIAQVNY